MLVLKLASRDPGWFDHIWHFKMVLYKVVATSEEVIVAMPKWYILHIPRRRVTPEILQN